jgi:hypothetical protein
LIPKPLGYRLNCEIPETLGYRIQLMHLCSPGDYNQGNCSPCRIKVKTFILPTTGSASHHTLVKGKKVRQEVAIPAEA